MVRCDARREHRESPSVEGWRRGVLPRSHLLVHAVVLLATDDDKPLSRGPHPRLVERRCEVQLVIHVVVADRNVEKVELSGCSHVRRRRGQLKRGADRATHTAHRTTLHHTAPHRTTPHHTALHHTTPHRTTPHHPPSHTIKFYDKIPYLLPSFDCLRPPHTTQW